MKKKKSIVAIVAVLTAVIGALVAIGAYLKRKARDLGDTLDYDGSIYFEDDDAEVSEEDAAENDDTAEESAE